MKKHANIIESLSYQFNKRFLVKIPTLKNGFLDKSRVTDVKYLDVDGVLCIAMVITGIPMIYKKSVKIIKVLEQSGLMKDAEFVSYRLKKGEFLSNDKL